MFLTEAEIRDLTKKQRCDSQRRELDFLGIPYKVRRDGSLLVLWADVAPRGNMVEREPQLHL